MRPDIFARIGLAILLALALPAQALDRHRVWHEGRQIEVVDVDGWAIYDGDIIIGRTAQVLERSRNDGPDGERIGTIAKSATIGGTGAHWLRGPSGLFELPYVIESDPDGNVPAAIALFNNALSGFMKAVPRTSESDYVAFTLSPIDLSGACSSSVGRVGVRQVIQGSRKCSGPLLVHEMGHAVGLFHEQEHPDADFFVRITLANVDPSRAHNYIPSTNRRGSTPYDFGSIMHYGATGFSSEGDATLETIPSGIPIGQRNGYSAADVEGIKRLYGAPPQEVIVATFPTGLTVLVDGVTTATPATFNWSLGSTHTLDVPGTPQVADGAAHVFARWNVDRSGDMASRRVIVVNGGNNSVTAPASLPAVSTYTANFVRYKEVHLTTSGNVTGVGGTVVGTPPPSSLPGVAGTYYRERQAFVLDASPNSGSAFGNWTGSYVYSPAYTSPYRSTFRGPLTFSSSLQTAYEYRAAFVNFPMLSIVARSQDGEALALKATVTPDGGASTEQFFPYNTSRWTSGQSGGLLIAEDTQTPLTPTIRYVFLDWDGNPSKFINVTSPAIGQSSRTLTANFSKEYQAYKEVVPSCGGSMALPGDATAFYPHGSGMLVTLSINSGWVLAGWEGSLAGRSDTVTNLTVTDPPNLIASLNTVATPLDVTSVSPATVTPGVPVTLQIDGTGFTSLSEVYVAGLRIPSTFVNATRLTASVTPSNLPATGVAVVTVTNRPGGAGSCSVSATGLVDVLGGAADSASYQGLWLKADESGWGVNLTHQGSIIFATWFTYDTDGSGMWLVASNVSQTGAGTFSGALYRTTGPAFNAVPFTSIVFPGNYTTVGTISFSFADANSGTMSYTVNGITQTKAITRFIYATGGTNCTLGGTQASPNYQDLWLNSPLGTESGWGLNLTHQGDILFGTWFTYQSGGKGQWLVMSNMSKVSTGVYSGPIQRTTGPAFSAVPFNPGLVNRATVGSATITFSDANNGTFAYSLDGISQSKPIARYIYSSPATVCQ